MFGSSKAFIFTLDTILAIIVCSILFLFTYSILAKYQYSIVRETSLTDACMDILTCLEKNHALRDSIYYSQTSELRDVLNNLSTTICPTILIYSEQNKPLLLISRMDCNCTGSRSVAVRSFVLPESNGTLSKYIAKMEACQK